MAHLSLRAKSLVALALACLLVLVPALLLGWQVSDGIRLYFAQAYGDNLTLLNRQKILAPIAVDLALSRRLANSEVTRQWLADESNPAHQALFFREVEGLRRELHDQAYFIASARSGHYYFNQQHEAFSAAPRYTLRRDDPADSWFYATLSEAAPYNINVNPDPKLGVTRVWINVRIVDGEQTLGISGASVDLTAFLKALTDSSRPGVVPMIVDGQGAIQAHADARRIAFNSGAAAAAAAAPAAAAPAVDTSAGDRSSVFTGLSPADAAALREAMALARQQPDAAHAVRVRFDDAAQLMSVAHVPELDWHIVTMVDPSAAQVLETHWMWAALACIAVLMAALLAAFGYWVERLILRPIRRLQQSARAVADGNYGVALPQRGNDEIADLSRAFNDMAARISAHTATLEDRVRERTTELEAANSAMAIAQKNLGDSIDYASLIQRAILPDRQLAHSLGERHFVLWRPRDVVGGDFYIFRADADNCLLGIMDCAGHGVPGALMTMLARAAIDTAIQEAGPSDPALILARCDSAMRGMLAEAHLPRALATNADAGLVYIDRVRKRLLFSGARLSLYVSDGTQVCEHKGVRRSLLDKRQGVFTNLELPLDPGHTFYLVTDGFLDQAGGDRGYGFGNDRFRDMLARHAAQPLADQPGLFTRTLAAYQGNHPQRDDITMLSFRFE